METLGLAGPRTASAHSTAQAAGISAQAVAAAQLGLPKLAVHHSAAITAATLLSSSTPGADQGPQASAVPAAASAAASNPASTSSRAESTGMHTSGPAPSHAQYPPVQGAGQHAQSSQQAPGSAADEHGARQDAAAHAAAEAAAEAERQRQREVADAARSRHVMLGAGSATKGSRRANQPAAHSQGAPSQQHTVELQQPEEHSAATGSSSSQAAGQLGAVNAADSMAGPPRRPRAGAGGVGGGRGSAGPGGSGNAVAAATMGRGGGFAGFDL